MIELVVVCDAWPACLHIGHVLGFVKCLERCTSSYPPHAEHRSVLTTFCALRVCSADALVWQCVWAEVAAQITLLTCSFELSLRAYSRECCPARCLAEILSLHCGGLCFGSCCCANLAHFLSTTTPLGAAVGHGCLNCSGASRVTTTTLFERHLRKLQDLAAAPRRFAAAALSLCEEKRHLRCAASRISQQRPEGSLPPLSLSLRGEAAPALRRMQ